MGRMSSTDASRPADPSIGPSTGGTLLRAALAVALLALGGWLLHLGTHESSLVQWECAAGTCASDQLASAAPFLGVLVLAAAATIALGFLGRATVGLLLAYGAGAALLGWRDAVADGLNTETAVRRPALLVTVLLVVGLVAGVVGGVQSLRRTGLLARLSGRRAAWARVTDYDTDAEGRVLATVHFDDDRGLRHAVRTVVPRDAFKRPAQALYDPERPDDPARLRVVLPGQPATAAARREREQAVRVRVPLPTDDLSSARPAPAARPARGTSTPATAGGATDLVAALDRLRVLHEQGALSDEEFAAAKAAVLRPGA